MVVTPSTLLPLATERNRNGSAARTPGDEVMFASTAYVCATGLRTTTSPLKRWETQALPPEMAPDASALTATALATAMVTPLSVSAVRLRRRTRLRVAAADLR